MSQPAPAHDDSYVLTLEEIGNLAAEGGKPAETLMNVVALIARRFQTDVCSAYLLEPDRANLVLAATVGLRPQCIGTLRMAFTKVSPAWWRSRCGRWPWSRLKNIRASNISAKPARTHYQSFLGVPLIDRGVLQGVLVVQTIDPRVFREDEIRMLIEAAAQVAPVVSEARTLDRFIAPAQERLWALARNLWWSWDHESSSLFRDLDPVRWRQLEPQSDLAADRNSARRNRAPRRANWCCTAASTTPIAASTNIWKRDRTWGARHAGVLRPRPVAYFSAEFGLHESIPDLFRRPGRAGRRSHQERIRSGHSAGRHRPVLRPGIFPPAARSRRLAAGRVHRRPMSANCRWSRRSARTASRSPCRSKPAAAPSAPKSGG